jgi:hypothetical protein
MAIELRNHFMNQLKIEIPLEQFFGDETVTTLLAYIQKQINLLAGVLQLDAAPDSTDPESETIFL